MWLETGEKRGEQCQGMESFWNRDLGSLHLPLPHWSKPVPQCLWSYSVPMAWFGNDLDEAGKVGENSGDGTEPGDSACICLLLWRSSKPNTKL